MSVRNTQASGPVVVVGGPARGDMALFANAAVDDLVAIALHMRAPDDDIVSILFGKERVTLEFYDVESLERLRDIADEGARRLRAAIEANARANAAEESAADDAGAAADRPGELVGGGVG